MHMSTRLHVYQAGILWLTVCIAGATGYQQAPLREEEVAKQRLLAEIAEPEAGLDEIHEIQLDPLDSSSGEGESCKPGELGSRVNGAGR